MADEPTPNRRRSRRILLVDDHPVVRERVAQIIQTEPGLAVCGEAAERAEALELVRLRRPHLVIIALALRNSDGLELIKDIHAFDPSIRMLVYSAHDESLYGERAICAGAHGYINKREPTRHILTAIHRVLEGTLHISRELALTLAARATGHAPTTTSDLLQALTEREREVFERVGEGWGTIEIAKRLHLSASTIKTHTERIRDKLNLGSAGEVRRAAIRSGRERD